MNVFEAYEVDQDMVDEGVWRELVLQGNVIGKVKLRPADTDLNTDYAREMMKMAREIREFLSGQDGDDQIDPEKDRAFLAGVYARSIVTDWDITGRNGKRIKTTEKAISDTLIKLPKLFSIIKRSAQNWGDYRKKFEAEAVKN